MLIAKNNIAPYQCKKHQEIHLAHCKAAWILVIASGEQRVNIAKLANAFKLDEKKYWLIVSIFNEAIDEWVYQDSNRLITSLWSLIFTTLRSINWQKQGIFRLTWELWNTEEKIKKSDKRLTSGLKDNDLFWSGVRPPLVSCLLDCKWQF